MAEDTVISARSWLEQDMKRLNEDAARRSSLDNQRSLHDGLSQSGAKVERRAIGDSRHLHVLDKQHETLDPIVDFMVNPIAAENNDAKEVFRTMFRSLVETLHFDFICFRARDESRDTCIQIVERSEHLNAESDSLLSPDALTLDTLEHNSSRKTFQVECAEGRVRGELLVGVSRDDFPSPAEQLVLNIATRKVVGDLDELTLHDGPVASRAMGRLSHRVVDTSGQDVDLLDERSRTPLDTFQRLAKGNLAADMSDGRLRETFDLVPVMAWSSLPDGRSEFLNRVHYEYTGMSAAQSQNWGWQRAIHPMDLAHRMKKWRESIESGQASEAEVRIRRHDGAYRWFLLRVEPFRDQFGTIVRWYGAGTDIEDRKRAEEKWSASEGQLSLIINTIPMLIWSSLPDGHADFFNQQWYNYTALSSSQSDGWGWTVALHPDDLTIATQHWRTIISIDDYDDSGFEVRFRRSDGIYRWFWVRANAIRNEVGVIKRWYVTSTDIHDRKLAEDGVRRSEALLAEVQRLAGLGTFSWRVGSDNVMWSAALYDMFGFDPETPVTQAMIEERTHPEDALILEKIKEEIEKNEKLEEQIRIRMPDHSVKYLHYCAYATTALTGEIEYVGTVQDITERHLAGEALARARVELAQAARASSLGVLTASIAHEVNQPLAGIVTNANTCLRMLNSDPPNVDGAIETARRTLRDGKRAADVISRLRKLFSHKQINASWWDMSDATREVIELVQSEIRRNRITLEELVDPELPLVKGDRIQLQQVVLNLIRNAIDAIEMNQAGPRNMFVGASYRDGFVHFSVKDSGIGFDASVADKLFEEFYTTKQDGMGIGLSVSRWIVEAHGGSVWATKNEDSGATFGFSLPSQDHSEAADEQGLAHMKQSDPTP